MEAYREDTIGRLRSSSHVAVITGAGISQESGIPTFRGPGGLWREHRAEELATPEAFARDPNLVWQWYDWRRGVCAKARPNPAHRVVAAMEGFYPDFLLITQNVDGLHRRAGSEKIIEIHGNLWFARCTRCGNLDELPATPLEAIPVMCAQCSGLSRPNVVWFGETYDPVLIDEALRFLASTDLVIVIGTSGMVPIPVQLATVAKGHGAFVIDVNPTPSAVGSVADDFIQEKAGEALPALWGQVSSAGEAR